MKKNNLLLEHVILEREELVKKRRRKSKKKKTNSSLMIKELMYINNVDITNGGDFTQGGQEQWVKSISSMDEIEGTAKLFELPKINKD